MADREVTTQIADVLNAHKPRDVADNTSRPGFRIWRNGCAACDWIGDDHAKHLAAVLQASFVVVTKGQLHQEWGWQLGDFEPARYPSRESAQARVDELDAMFGAAGPGGKKHSSLPRRVVSRLVGPWRPTDSKEGRQ